MLLLAGCGANTGSYGGNSGVGADGGPWPTRGANNNSQHNSDIPAPNEQPKAPLLIVLKATTAEGESMSLNVASVDLRYDKGWYTVVTKDGKNGTAKFAQSMPVTADEKGATVLLANTQAPRRKYTSVRLTFADERTTLIPKGAEASPLPLLVEKTTINIGEMSLEPAEKNVLTIAVDGAAVEKHPTSATIPAKAVTAAKDVATGSISGVLNPAVANARITAIWGDSTIELGHAVADTQKGAFTVNKLPAGHYTIKISAAGHRLVDPLTKLIAVGSKDVSLGAIQLAEEPRP